MSEPRVASLPDDPAAPLADRLLLALGIAPSFLEQVTEDQVAEATVIIRSQAHRFPMVIEDWGVERELREQLSDYIRAMDERVGSGEAGATIDAERLLAEALALITDPDDDAAYDEFLAEQGS